MYGQRWIDDTISIRGNEGTMQGQTQEKALTFLKTKSSFVVLVAHKRWQCQDELSLQTLPIST